MILSVRDGDDANLRELEAGADDCLTKPFSVPELLARMRVALRHSATYSDAASGAIASGGVDICLTRRVVRRGGT